MHTSVTRWMSSGGSLSPFGASVRKRGSGRLNGLCTLGIAAVVGMTMTNAPTLRKTITSSWTTQRDKSASSGETALIDAPGKRGAPVELASGSSDCRAEFVRL